MKTRMVEPISNGNKMYGKRGFHARSSPLPSGKTKKKKHILAVSLVALLVGACVLLLHPIPPSRIESAIRVPVGPREQTPREPWAALSELLAREIHEIPGRKCIEIPVDEDQKFTIRSSLDPDFQSLAENRLRNSKALAGTAVVMIPSTGRLLALSVYNSDPDRPLAFFWKTYPAASIFKMVTASAALDKNILTPDSSLDYTGRPHTLYRKHLDARSYPWSTRVTLEAAFARSINPVFGKIGIHQLGQDALEEYGSAFFFNQAFPCEIPLETSTFCIRGDPLGIAEAASGFNRETLLTPVQAAWIGSVVAGEGSAPAPWLVENISPGGLTTPSLEHHEVPIRVLCPHTAREMQQLMEATIRYGTCRRSFCRRNQYPHLRPLTFGGKTGTINDREDRVKYDWFVGYAKAPNPEDNLVVSVLMLHGEKLGHRANLIAFELLNDFFRQMESRKKSPRGPS
jgi:penicillin-binding protein A